MAKKTSGRGENAGVHRGLAGVIPSLTILDGKAWTVGEHVKTQTAPTFPFTAACDTTKALASPTPRKIAMSIHRSTAAVRAADSRANQTPDKEQDHPGHISLFAIALQQH